MNLPRGAAEHSGAAKAVDAVEAVELVEDVEDVEDIEAATTLPSSALLLSSHSARSSPLSPNS